MERLQTMAGEAEKHLSQTIIPFWKNLRDDACGGYYGLVDYDLQVDRKAEKGCILNSRITWFFSKAYCMLGDESLLDEARHGYEFLKERCIDREYGGVFWSLTYDGQPKDTTKHTYNQAFCIYALSAYYEAAKDPEALALAEQLFTLIETRCTDPAGYCEAYTRDFQPESNEKLSENGVLADKTMNTLLHVFEAYTEYYRVSQNSKVRERLCWMLGVFADKIYNPTLHRQEVFFDKKYHSLIDLHSYGHDIETAWLIDYGVEVLGDAAYEEKMYPITRSLTEKIYKVAFDGRSLANECEKGVVDTGRVWWVQAETVVGFVNGFQHTPEHTEYMEAAQNTWKFIQEYVVDKRTGSEWFWLLTPEGAPVEGRPIVEPWKCPYHNGRMCLELMRRA